MLCAFNRARRDDGRSEERGGGQVATDFLKHQRCLDRAEPEAAIAFRNADAG
jgi:hypothetical protein